DRHRHDVPPRGLGGRRRVSHGRAGLRGLGVLDRPRRARPLRRARARGGVPLPRQAGRHGGPRNRPRRGPQGADRARQPRALHAAPAAVGGDDPRRRPRRTRRGGPEGRHPAVHERSQPARSPPAARRGAPERAGQRHEHDAGPRRGDRRGAGAVRRVVERRRARRDTRPAGARRRRERADDAGRRSRATRPGGHRRGRRRPAHSPARARPGAHVRAGRGRRPDERARPPGPGDARPQARRMTRVDVVVTCYQHGAFLEAAVRSALAQEGVDVRVAIVDDGSTDGSADVARALAAADARVQAIVQDNQGVAVARNVGIAATDADLFVCLDADDELAPGFLRACVESLERHPWASYAYCDQQNTGESTTFERHPPYDATLLRRFNYILSTAVTRRKAWQDVGGYAPGIGYEDWDFWLGCSEHGHRGIHVPEAALLRRVTSSGRYRSDTRSDAEAKATIVTRHPALY